MATYTIDNAPMRLQDGDRIIFVVGGKESEYYVSNGCPWLRGRDDGRDVFEDLKITPLGKKSLTKSCFGYPSLDYSYWPSAKLHDFAAHCRLVNALYDLIEELEGKKTESNPDKGDNEPGIFLGYDWVPADEPLGTSTKLSKSGHETIDAACEDAAEHGYDTCLVFMLCAVGAHKYTRKFVQED